MPHKRFISVASVAKICLLAGGSACLWSVLAQAEGLGETERSARIGQLIVEAKQALVENRLTVPSGNNAVGYAQQVLDLAPNNLEAQQILRDVVVRYGSLSEAALDRGEAAQARETERALTYQGRGERVAKRYQLPDDELQRVEERLGQGTSVGSARAAGVPEQHPVGRQALQSAVRRYIGLTEGALSKGDVLEAQHYKNIAEDLVTHYRLPDPGLASLASRVAQAEEAWARAAKNAAAGSVMDASSFSYTRDSVFLPPSF